MCGLVGIMSSNMMMKHKQCLASMLYLDTWRGRDSTGVAALRHNADTAILKATIPGYEFVEGPKLEEFLRLNDFLWIGHNRYGTVGKNIKTNAHPFQILDEDGACIVVGAHNGTIKNKHVYKDHGHFGTDSEALYNNIAHEGVEETLKKSDGAWALTYYDHLEEEFRVIRNKERPLFYAFEKGKKSLIWASEMWMIRVSTSRANIELEDDKVFQFNEDTLYRVPVPLKMNETLELHRKGGVTGKVTGFFHQTGFWDHGAYVPAARRQNTGGQQGQSATTPQQKANQETQKTGQVPPLAIPHSQSGTTQQSSGETPQQKKEEKSEGQSGSNVTPIDKLRVFKGYAGVLLTKGEIQNQLDNGCGWCEKEHIALSDKGYGWLAPGKPICKKCLDGENEDQEQIDMIFAQIGGHC